MVGPLGLVSHQKVPEVPWSWAQRPPGPGSQVWWPSGGWELRCGGTRARGLGHGEPWAVDVLMDAHRASITDTGTPVSLVSDLGPLGLRSQARGPQGLGFRCRDPRTCFLAARTLGPGSQTTNSRAWVSDVGTFDRVLDTEFQTWRGAQGLVSEMADCRACISDGRNLESGLTPSCP